MSVCNKRGRNKFAMLSDDVIDFTVWYALKMTDEWIFFGKGFPTILTPIPTLPIDVDRVGRQSA